MEHMGIVLDCQHATALIDVREKAAFFATLLCRRWRCGATRDDVRQDAECWAWFHGQQWQRMHPAASDIPDSVAWYAARRACGARHFGGTESAKSIHCRQATGRDGPVLRSLDVSRPQSDADNAQADELFSGSDFARLVVPAGPGSDPAALAGFWTDWTAFLATLTARDRSVLADLAQGERVKEIAARFGITSGRVSQLRRTWADAWAVFTS